MLCVWNPASRLLQIGHKLEKWQWRHNLPTCHHRQSSLVTGPSVMSISSLVLELWQFSFIRHWPEIQKSDITLSGFCPISGDRRELGIPNLPQMLPNVAKCQGYSFNCFWLIEGKPTEWEKFFPPPPPNLTQIRVKLTFCPIQDRKRYILLSFSSIWKLVYWF